MSKQVFVASIGGDNSIGAIRLIAALLVVLGHSFPIGGYGVDPLIGLTSNQIAIGRLSVDVFFCLSGYLIAKSFENRRSFFGFVWARFLRIYPAYWVCLAFTAFVISPYLRDAISWGYFFRNFPLLVGGVGVLSGAAPEWRAENINSALWTLKWELFAYIFCALVGLVGLLSRRWVVFSIFLIFWFVFIFKIYSYPGLSTSPAVTSGWRLFSFFSCGMFFYAARDTLELRWAYGLLAAFVLGAALAFGNVWAVSSGGMFYAVAPLPLTYIVFWAAKVLPLQKINSENDISYGVYIYGTLLLTAVAEKRLGLDWLTYFLGVSFLTIFLAVLSWFLVEKPALKLKNKLPALKFWKYNF
jgi:peptidoglycan/LPS O-acetylase OafA/YrhL